MNKWEKLVIYGSGRYPKDFLYVFDQLKVSYFVDDEAHDDVRSYQCLMNEEVDKVFVIICKYDEKNARENLNNIGFRKGMNYQSAADLFQRLDFPIQEISRERDVYVWGTGDISHHFFHDYVEKNPDVEIVGCIDSDSEKKGKTFFRRPVYLPDEVLDSDRPFFIIASTRYYKEIKEKLKACGKEEGEDFISSLGIHQWASWMMRETIYDTPRLDYVCPKAFQDMALMGEGRVSVCSGVKHVTDWNMPMFYADFEQVWKSNIMKILRLSMVNGTYSFCDVQKCDLIQNCGRRTIDTNELHYFTNRTKEQIDYIEQKKALPKDFIFKEKNYDIRENEYPRSVMCSFDGTCNLHCPSCRKEIYTANQEQRKAQQDFTESIKEELLPYIHQLKLAGDGEVFASKIYKSIVFDEKLADQVKEIGILSNGTLFTPANFEKLASLYPSIKVFISMDGCTKKTAERLRAGADFESWTDNMRYLGEKRREGNLRFLAFNFVVQRANYREMPEFVKMCLEFSADGIKFSPLRKMGYSTEKFEELTMFDSNGDMKPELAEVVKDEIFKRPEVHLFTWIDW